MAHRKNVLNPDQKRSKRVEFTDHQIYLLEIKASKLGTNFKALAEHQMLLLIDPEHKLKTKK